MCVCVCSLIPPPSTHLRVGFCATPGSTDTGITEEEVNVEPMAILPCLPGALDTLLLTVTGRNVSIWSYGVFGLQDT